MKPFRLGEAVKGLVALSLSLGVLWWVVEQSGPREGVVILHVMERDVRVTLAGRDYDFQEMTTEPLVVRVLSGRYGFQVRRRGIVLHTETFTLRGGETMVLVAIRDDRGVLGAKCRRSAGGSRHGGGTTIEGPMMGRRPR